MRSAALCYLSTLPTTLLLRLIHPAFYSLHDMPDDTGLVDPATGNIVMPPLLNLSSAHILPYVSLPTPPSGSVSRLLRIMLTTCRVYISSTMASISSCGSEETQFPHCSWMSLVSRTNSRSDKVCAAISVIIYEPTIVEQRLTSCSFLGKTTLPLLDNDFSQRIHAVLEKARDHTSKMCGSIVVPTLYVVRESGDPNLKLWAQTLLVEDRADQGVSLQQWLGMLREKVRSTLEDVPLILSTWPD